MNLTTEDYQLVYSALCEYRQYCCMKDEKLWAQATRLIDDVRPLAYTQRVEQPT
jgi:hypothetical protein